MSEQTWIDKSGWGAEALLAEHVDRQCCEGCGAGLIPAEHPTAYWSPTAGGWVCGERCEGEA